MVILSLRSYSIFYYFKLKLLKNLQTLPKYICDAYFIYFFLYSGHDHDFTNIYLADFID